MIRSTRPSVWVLRALVLLGLMVALYAAAPEGFVPSPFLTVVVLVAGIGSALRPEYFVSIATPTIVLVWWALVVQSAFPDGTLVAAAALLTSHVAAVLLGYGPPTMPVGADLVLLWLPRGAAVWLAALMVWFTAHAYSGHATPSEFWLTGLAAAIVGAVVAAVVLPTTRPLQEGE